MARAGAVRTAAAPILLALALGDCGADDALPPGDGSDDGMNSTQEPLADSDPLDLVNMWRISGTQLGGRRPYRRDRRRRPRPVRPGRGRPR